MHYRGVACVEFMSLSKVKGGWWGILFSKELWHRDTYIHVHGCKYASMVL